MAAWTLLAYLPEITSLSRRQISALAGLAPYNRDSGKTEGKRHIQAGRPKVRKALYMPAVVATRHNPHIKDFYQGLIQRGKPPKVALVAVIRKLIMHVRSLLLDFEKMTA